MQKTRILTGITTTGTPHLGNYVGAIRPAIAASRDANAESFYFLADYHALVKCDDPARVQRSTLEIAASWLACGLDPQKVYFYRQSDIPEIPELTWLLTCVTAKGLLNRAHAYKATTDANREKGEDADAGITAGLYMYPVLMAADILIFNAHKVPVGRDQIQHIEMARDIGQRFNHLYSGEYFTLPEAAIEDNVATLPGLDGRKMSKSYNNAIPLWLDAKDLRKAILGIVTNSQAPGEAKNPDDSNIFSIYRAFASAEETAAMRQAFVDGIGWGDAKQKLFERIDAELAPMREKYTALIAKPEQIEETLNAGAARAHVLIKDFIKDLREAVGLKSLSVAPSSPLTENDQLFARAYKAALGSDEVIPLEVKGPWPDGEKIGLTISYSQRGTFVAEDFPSMPEAGRAKKKLEKGIGLKVDRTRNEDGLYALELYLDDKKIGRGNAFSVASDADAEEAKFWQSVEMRKAQNAELARKD
ncbi:tryptophan--tRNA ligase [Rudaea sp.]|jgi:tryptophanyl-tRNA synthetase|uniref:tryptophan--tRNA ligase n=1 Tax=Rudaea sp. TaxID=2136325 RepID=UPI0039C9D38F